MKKNITFLLCQLLTICTFGKISETAQDYSPLLSRTFFSGGTGLMSTAEDYL
jgi:hypothetical protein